MKASYFNSNNEKVFLSIEDVQKQYDLENDKFFDGKLPKIFISSVANTKSFAFVRSVRNRITKEMELTGMFFSHSFSFANFECFRNTLIHEMIHIWQFFYAYNDFVYRPHGYTFLEFSKKIQRIESDMLISERGDVEDMKQQTSEVFLLVIDKKKVMRINQKTIEKEYEYFKNNISRVSSLKGKTVELCRVETNLYLKNKRSIITRKGISYDVINDLETKISSKTIIDNFVI